MLEVKISPDVVAIETNLDSWLGAIKTKVSSRILQHLDSNTDEMDRYISIG